MWALITDYFNDVPLGHEMYTSGSIYPLVVKRSRTNQSLAKLVHNTYI